MMDSPVPDTAYRILRWRQWLAGVWAILIVILYAQRQIAMHWSAIQAQIIHPLLDTIR